jgi:ricin-type beta-trefoil lectin protein
MKRICGKILAAIGVSVALVALAAPAGAAISDHHAAAARAFQQQLALPDSWGNHTFSFENSTELSRCLGINSTGDAGLWNCTYQNDQEWFQGPHCIDDNIYCQLENAEGKCLGVAGGSTANGAKVVDFTCEPTSHKDQFWAGFIGQDQLGCDGTTLMNADGKVIGTASGGVSNGTSLVIWSNQDVCNNQIWLQVFPNG